MRRLCNLSCARCQRRSVKRKWGDNGDDMPLRARQVVGVLSRASCVPREGAEIWSSLYGDAVRSQRRRCVRLCLLRGKWPGGPAPAPSDTFQSSAASPFAVVVLLLLVIARIAAPRRAGGSGGGRRWRCRVRGASRHARVRRQAGPAAAAAGKDNSRKRKGHRSGSEKRREEQQSGDGGGGFKN